MSVLETYVKQQIKAHGPMDVGTFMGMALGHPQYGYYMKQDPFGKDGDFTTSPEISQMFGEVLGAWAVAVWIKMDRPNPFLLVECGPGRGTMMLDMLRGTKNVEDFYDAVQVRLVENSNILRRIQMDTLKDYATKCRWESTLNSVPEDMPMILLANEFLDALPVRQLEMVDGIWKERIVTVGDDNNFAFGHRESRADITFMIPPTMINVPEGKIFEVSIVRDFFIRNLCTRLEEQKGVALFIDYGHTKSGLGETIQAVKNHEHTSFLEDIGDVDLTSHVDFDALVCAVKEEKLFVRGPVDQGGFLRKLGIHERATILKENATSQQSADITSALERLTGFSEMGHLFKVIAICDNDCLDVDGFNR